MLKKIAILSLVAVASILSAAEVENVGKLEDVVVTATGFDEAQNNQIKNLTIITKEDIQNKGYNTVEDVLKNAPGLNVVQTGFGSAIDVRGQGRMGSANLAKAVSNVKILIDGGVAMETLDISHAYIPLNTISVDDVERIEIINGGGTVLYGSGTRGGVVNIITKKNSKEGASGKVYAQASSFNTVKLGFDAGINFENRLIFDFGYENINGRGYRENEKTSSGYAKGGITYNITDNHSLKFKVSRYSGYERTSDGISEIDLANNRKKAGSTEIEADITRKEYTLGYDAKLNDKFQFSVLGYKQDLDRITDGGNGIFDDEKKGVNVKGNFNYGNGNIILGYEYADNDLLRSSYAKSPTGSGTIIRDTKINLGKTTNSVFALNRHSFTDKLETTLGYRYEKADYDIDRKATVDMQMGPRTINLSNNVIKNKTKKSNSAYEAGINYKYSDTGNVYAKYERGFRLPGATELIDNKASTLIGPGGRPITVAKYLINNMESEKYNTYEIGVKDMIGNSYVSATAFYTNTDDEIYININHIGTPTWKYENIKETERLGFELFAEQYFNKLRINESVSYVRAKIKDVYAGSDYKAGQKIPYVPSTKVTLGAVYNILPELSVNADLNYYSSSIDNGNKKIKGYSTTDLGVKYLHNSGFGIQAGVKNLFDEKYNKSQSTSTSISSYIPAQERTYHIGVNYAF